MKLYEYNKIIVLEKIKYYLTLYIITRKNQVICTKCQYTKKGKLY